MKIKCFDTTIYMKTQCLQKMRRSIMGKENAWEAKGGVEKE